MNAVDNYALGLVELRQPLSGGSRIPPFGFWNLLVRKFDN